MIGALPIAIGTLALAASAIPAGAAPPAACAAHWKVVLDDESFANNGASQTFSKARLAAFRANIEAAVKSAIADGCRSGKVKPALAKDVRRVTVTSASGAPAAVLFPLGRSTLDFEYPFAEDDLAVPSRNDILDGIACWTRPNSRRCAELQQD